MADVILVFLLSTLNTFHNFFQCLCCWLWTSKCYLGCFFSTPLEYIRKSKERDQDYRKRKLTCNGSSQFFCCTTMIYFWKYLQAAVVPWVHTSLHKRFRNVVFWKIYSKKKIFRIRFDQFKKNSFTKMHMFRWNMVFIFS